MAWQFHSTEPVFIQIAKRIRNDILAGKYAPDAQFPTVRFLASEAGVNPNTMQKAFVYLEEEKLLYARGTVGRFVTGDTEVLRVARERMCRETVRHFLEEADALGISRDDLFRYLREEDYNNGYAGSYLQKSEKEL